MYKLSKNIYNNSMVTKITRAPPAGPATGCCIESHKDITISIVTQKRTNNTNYVCENSIFTNNQTNIL